MGPRVPAVLGVLVLVGVAGACVDANPYACSSDAQCVDGGVTGYCEPSGYCSFDDPTCESGRRYGNLAPVDLAGKCTAPADEPTGWVDLTTSISTTGPEESSSGDVTTQTSASATTPVDPATSSASDAVTGTTTDESGPDTETAGSSATSEPVVPTCTPVVSDDFDDAMMDPVWEGNWASAGCSFAESDGALVFSVAPNMQWLSAGYHTEPSPMTGGYVRAQVLPFTAPQEVVGVWLSLYDESECELQIAIENSLIRGRVDQTWFDTSMVATDEPIWLQLRTEPDSTVHWEWSTDGMTWNLEHSEESPCDLSSVRSAIFAGGEHAEADPVTRSVDFYERCDPA